MPDTLLGGIAINEVLIDPNSPTNNYDTDNNGNARGGDEFIELINTSGTAIDIGGLELWDAGRGNWFTFPPNTTLEPGARAVVVRNVQNGGSLPSVTGDDLAFDANFGQNVFNNGADNIVIYDPSNDEYIQAVYNGDSVDDPTASYSGFSATATQSGAGEDLGNDIDGRSIQRYGDDFYNDDVATPGGENVCFVSGTRLLTPDGFRAVEQLRPGDLLQTRDAGPQPIRWVFARRVTVAQMQDDPSLRPISLAGGALGQADAGQPALWVSRHHRIKVRGAIVRRMFGADSVLVPAKDLIAAPGVQVRSPERSFHYVHVLLDGHHILNAEGIAAESLLLGQQALDAMTPDALAELELLFPDGIPPDLTDKSRAARPIAVGHRVRRLVTRHRKNRRALAVAF